MQSVNERERERHTSTHAQRMRDDITDNLTVTAGGFDHFFAFMHSSVIVTYTPVVAFLSFLKLVLGY